MRRRTVRSWPHSGDAGPARRRDRAARGRAPRGGPDAAVPGGRGRERRRVATHAGPGLRRRGRGPTRRAGPPRTRRQARGRPRRVGGAAPGGRCGAGGGHEQHVGCGAGEATGQMSGSVCGQANHSASRPTSRRSATSAVSTRGETRPLLWTASVLGLSQDEHGSSSAFRCDLGRRAITCPSLRANRCRHRGSRRAGGLAGWRAGGTKLVSLDTGGSL